MKTTKFKLTITPELVERTMECGMNPDSISENCLISVAIKDIMPKGYTIITEHERVSYKNGGSQYLTCRTIDPRQKGLIDEFDTALYKGTKADVANKRRELIGRELFVYIPDEIIEEIDISNINSKEMCLELK